MRELHHPVDPLQGECTGPQATGELQQMAGAGEEVVVEGSAPHPLLHTVPGAAQVAPVLHRPADEVVGTGGAVHSLLLPDRTARSV